MKEILALIFSKLTFKDYIIIFLVILSGIFYFNYKRYYNKALTPTVVYNTDSLEIYKNKIKEEYVAKDIYIQNIDILKKQNTELSDELSKLKDNPIVITQTDLQIKIDTIYAKSDTIIKNDSIYNLKWHINEEHNFYAINGITFVNNECSWFQTTLNNICLNTKLTLDILDNGDNTLRLIGKTDNPYIHITNFDGVIFDPNSNNVLKKYYNRKKFSIGPTIGYGLTGDYKFRPYIGVGITYGIIQF